MDGSIYRTGLRIKRSRPKKLTTQTGIQIECGIGRNIYLRHLAKFLLSRAILAFIIRHRRGIAVDVSL